MELNRGMDAAMLAALDGGVFYPVLFTYLDWPDAAVYAHTAPGTIAFGGHDWAGVGDQANIELPDESVGSLVATEATISVVASPEMIDDYLDDAIRGRAGAVRFGLLTDRPGKSTTLIGTPVTLFSGAMDTLEMSVMPAADGGVETAISVGLATGPSARSSASVYHSNETQSAAYPSDTAGRLTVLAYAKAQKLLWPES